MQGTKAVNSSATISQRYSKDHLRLLADYLFIIQKNRINNITSSGNCVNNLEASKYNNCLKINRVSNVL